MWKLDQNANFPDGKLKTVNTCLRNLYQHSLSPVCCWYWLGRGLARYRHNLWTFSRETSRINGNFSEPQTQTDSLVLVCQRESESLASPLCRGCNIQSDPCHNLCLSSGGGWDNRGPGYSTNLLQKPAVDGFAGIAKMLITEANGQSTFRICLTFLVGFLIQETLILDLFEELSGSLST